MTDRHTPRPTRLIAPIFALAMFAGSVIAQETVEPPSGSNGNANGNGIEGLDEPRPFLDLTSWDGSIELGLFGSSGNNERVSLRTALGLVRTTEDLETSFRTVYTYAKEDGNETANRLLTTIRNDWLFPDSPWRAFARGELDYDEFQQWDVRWTLSGGPAYELIDNDDTFLLLRAGGALTQTVGGGSENKITPEGLLGFDFRHDFTERQRVFANFDYFFAVDDIGPYRFVANAGWEILVDPELNMTLRIGIENRYDSRPGDGFNRNDLDYFVTLVWSF